MIPVRPNYLKIYSTNLCHILRIRTMAVHDQTEISFSIPQGTLPWQPIFVSAWVSLGAGG